MEPTSTHEDESSRVFWPKNDKSWMEMKYKPQPRNEKLHFWCLHSYLGMFFSDSCYFDSFHKHEDGVCSFNWRDKTMYLLGSQGFNVIGDSAGWVHCLLGLRWLEISTAP